MNQFNRNKQISQIPVHNVHKNKTQTDSVKLQSATNIHIDNEKCRQWSHQYAEYYKFLPMELSETIGRDRTH